MPTQPSPAIVTERDLNRYFLRHLDQAAQQQRLRLPPDVHQYLAQLLSRHARAGALFDQGPDGPTLPALAQLYGRAVAAENRRERHLFLRRLGDLALFVSGMFGGWIRCRAVDADYFIDMGRSAYGSLAAEGAGNGRVFEGLAYGFSRWAGLLDALCLHAPWQERLDPLRLLERWSPGNNERLRRRLLALGLQPADGPATRP